LTDISDRLDIRWGLSGPLSAESHPAHAVFDPAISLLVFLASSIYMNKRRYLNFMSYFEYHGKSRAHTLPKSSRTLSLATFPAQLYQLQLKNPQPYLIERSTLHDSVS
jgi:hypothetical protein